MAGRPLGADDSALAREPGETSLLSTLLKPGLSGQPMRPQFSAEGPDQYKAAYATYSPFAKPGPYNTKLSPQEEVQFRTWLKQYNIPFDPNAPVSDYDMRAYWKNNQSATHQAGQHFPDTYKTPYDTTFSRESMYATPDNPFAWQGDQLVNMNTGQLMYGYDPASTIRTLRQMQMLRGAGSPF